MAARGWERLFVADGAPRAPWRLLLFVLLYAAFLAAGTRLVAHATAALGVPPPASGRAALFQRAISLAAALAAGWILLARADGRPPGALGFAWTSRSARELGIGFAIGAGSLAGAAAAFALAGWLAYRPEAGTAGALAATLAGDLVVLGIAAAFEETLFRGYPFQVLVQALGPVVPTFVLSLAFAVAHRNNPGVGPLALVNIFLAGVMLSAAYLRTRSLWFATALHLGWNWTMASALDLPVSGLAVFDTPLYDPVDAGPRWITGGAFGPEGGIGASVALGAALAAVLRIPALGEAPEMKALRPLADRWRKD